MILQAFVGFLVLVSIFASIYAVGHLVNELTDYYYDFGDDMVAGAIILSGLVLVFLFSLLIGSFILGKF